MREVFLPIIDKNMEADLVLPPLEESIISFTAFVSPHHREDVENLAEHLKDDVRRVLGIDIATIEATSEESRAVRLADIISRLIKSLLRTRCAAKQSINLSNASEPKCPISLLPRLTFQP